MSFGSILGALASPINMVGNVVTSLINKKSVSDTNKANFQLAQWQQQQNEKMWQMNNEYNAPSAQMERLKEAGLNPNLVYGSGAVGNSSAQPSPASLPTMAAYQAPQNILGGLDGMFDAALKVANIKKTEQETKNLAETQRVTSFQADKAKLEVDYQGYINAKTKEEAAAWKRKLELDLALTDANANRAWSEIGLNSIRGTDLNSQIKYRDGVQTASTIAGTALTREKTISTIAERGLIQFQKAVMQGQVASLLASANASNASADATRKGMQLTDAQIQKVAAEILNLDLSKESKELENDIKRIMLNEGMNVTDSGAYGLINRIGHMINTISWPWK